MSCDTGTRTARGISLQTPHAMSSTAYEPRSTTCSVLPMQSLRHVQCCRGYCLWNPYVDAGTEIGYGPVSTWEGTCATMSMRQVSYANAMRACYAMFGTGSVGGYRMPGTGLACTAISLRARYPMPGTDIAYDAISLRACYAISGPDAAYQRRVSGTTRGERPVLTQRTIGECP
eukprot:1586608-Rhodomonas_salina.7